MIGSGFSGMKVPAKDFFSLFINSIKQVLCFNILVQYSSVSCIMHHLSQSLIRVNFKVQKLVAAKALFSTIMVTFLFSSHDGLVERLGGYEVHKFFCLHHFFKNHN